MLLNDPNDDRKTLIIKLTGNALESDSEVINSTYLVEFGKFVESLLKNWRIAITVGGGKTARRYISAARKLGLPDSKASLIGGDIGLLNCRLIIASLTYSNVRTVITPLESWDNSEEYLAKGVVPVFSGRWPFLTSDSVAAYFADYVTANLVLKLSGIDAVYNKDPNQYGDAKPLRRLSHDQLEEMAKLVDQRTAGSQFVIDFLAAKRLKNSRIPLFLVHKDKLEVAAKTLDNSNWQNINEGTLVETIDR